MTRERLGYRPALEGLRGLAILLVLASHVFPQAFAVGAVGVILFFVLSGFLITTLLLEERERKGRISLAAFYRRRGLRLLPALAVYLAVVTPLAIWLRPSDANVASALSTLFYVANWHQAADPYHVGAFGQMWSLGIEEQFYLTWPLLLIGLIAVLSPRRIALVACAIAAASVILRIVNIGQPWPLLYFETQYRIDAIAIGCALALWGLPRRWRLLGLPILAIVAAMPLSGGFAAVGLALAAVGGALLVAQAMTSPIAWMSWPPLRWLGRISYGLYLWQGAVFLFLAALPWPLLVGISLVIAMASYRWVELPFPRARKPVMQPSTMTVSPAAI